MLNLCNKEINGMIRDCKVLVNSNTNRFHFLDGVFF